MGNKIANQKNRIKKRKMKTDHENSVFPDINSDKTSKDDDADKTIKRNESWRSKLDIDPDSTKTDNKSDKTKKEKRQDE
jgi:hypothetical protein